MKKKRKFLAMIAAIMLLIGTAMPVQAAGGWWIDSENVGAEIYGGTGEESLESIDLSEIEEGNVNAFEAILGDIVYWIGKGLDTVVNRSGDVKLGIDNVVLGRMAAGGGDISYMQFGLETGNPWGIIGARIFVAIRSVIYGAFLLYVQFTLILQLLKGGGGRGRAETKEVIQNAFFCFLMIYAIPFLTQAILYFRDVCMYLVINKIGGGAGTTAGILGTFEAVFLAHKSILNALFYLATTLAGLWFLSNYIGNALIQAGLFGAAPFVLLRSIKSKRLFQQWFNTFTINMAIPLIDAAFLMIPSVLGKILQNNGVSSMNFAFMLVRLFLIFSIIPARNGVLRLLSESTGGGLMPAGGGMGALGAMAARAAMRAMNRGDGGSIADRSSLHSEDPDHDRDEADTLLSNNDSITAAQHDVLNQVPNIDELLGQSSSSIGSESFYEQERAAEQLDSICGSIPDTVDSPEVPESAIDDTITAASAVPEYRDPGAVEQEPDQTERISGAIPEEPLSSGFAPEIEEIDFKSPDPIAQGGDLSDLTDLQASAAAQTAALPAIDRGGVPAPGRSEWGASPDRLYGSTQYDLLSNEVQERDETAQARYENLQKIESCGAAMTANDQKIRELSLQEASLDRQIASARMEGGGSMAADLEDAQVRKADYQNDMLSARADMKQFKAEGADLRRQIADHDSGKRVMSREELQQTKHAEQRARQHYAAAAERYEAAKENYQDADAEIRQIQSGSRSRVTDLQEQKAAIHERKVALQQNNQSLQGAQAAYKKAEIEYADLDKAKGGSGQKFNSSAVYKETAEAQARRAKLANVLNFDSSKFNGVLTPEERAERLRERALLGDRRVRMQEIRRKTEMPRKIAAGIAGAAVGVAVTAYGGERNAAMGAMLGMEGADLLSSGHPERAPRTEEEAEDLIRRERARNEQIERFKNLQKMVH